MLPDCAIKRLSAGLWIELRAEFLRRVGGQGEGAATPGVGVVGPDIRAALRNGIGGIAVAAEHELLRDNRLCCHGEEWIFGGSQRQFARHGGVAGIAGQHDHAGAAIHDADAIIGNHHIELGGAGDVAKERIEDVQANAILAGGVCSVRDGDFGSAIRVAEIRVGGVRPIDAVQRAGRSGGGCGGNDGGGRCGGDRHRAGRATGEQ